MSPPLIHVSWDHIGRVAGGAQIPVSGERGAQLTSRVEQCLVDRVAVGPECDDQGVERDALQHDRDEHLPLPLGEVFVDGPVQRVDQRLPLGLVGRVHPEPVGQPVPVLGIECDRRFLPEVSAELGRDLEDDELVGPGGEPALARGTPPSLPVMASSASAAA